MTKPQDKPFAIPKQLVWEAYRRVAANKGAPGVDGQSLDEFDAGSTAASVPIPNSVVRMSPRRTGSTVPSPTSQSLKLAVTLNMRAR